MSSPIRVRITADQCSNGMLSPSGVGTATHLGAAMPVRQILNRIGCTMVFDRDYLTSIGRKNCGGPKVHRVGVETMKLVCVKTCEMPRFLVQASRFENTPACPMVDRIVRFRLP